MARRITGLVAGILLAATALLPAAGWETLLNCRVKDSQWNDGDSFHVISQGKEYIFRLCYVDTPETESHKDLTERTTEQARYWKISKSDMFPLAAEAATYTRSVLSGGFTVKTQWEDARGESQLPRYFGVIITPQGDLAELLVSRGYARVYGFSPDYPGGLDANKFKAKLRALEATAREKSLGAWAFSKGKADPAKASEKKEPAAPEPAGKNALDDIPAF